MAEVPAPARRPLRFSSFELDPQSGELRKAGVLVGLQEQSLKVLVELLERPGDLVTREQLRQRLWPNGTFVDFEHGLNAVINRLRETLGDSAESPRFIQTVPRRGYRFIAPVEGGVAVTGSGARNRRSRPSNRASVSWMAIGAAGIVLVCRGHCASAQSPLGREPIAEDRGAHETGRQGERAGLRAGRRAGRVRLVRREARQQRYLRHAGGVDERSAPDDGSGRRLRARAGHLTGGALRSFASWTIRLAFTSCRHSAVLIRS